jgi:hypothetical protein
MAGGNFTIVDDNGNWHFGFGNSEREARRALDVMHFYQIDSSCFAGRLHPPMMYLLSSGKPPVGKMPDEQCEPFDATRIILSQSGEFWKILSGPNVLFDFAKKEQASKLGLLVLHHYEFMHQCTVGLPTSSFRYLRR